MEAKKPKEETVTVTDETQEGTGYDEFLKVGIHIGTKFRSAVMKPFIYRIRQDGLAILDVQMVVERLNVVGSFLSKYEPADVLVVCRRENGWKTVEMFKKLTGVRVITGRYPPGILTNPKLETFTEAKLIFVVDPYADRNAIRDAEKLGVVVIALCDTNNDGKSIDLIMPCNNKGKKSLALIFMTLAKKYLLERGIIKNESEFNYKLEDFYIE